mmetsp:Transcript_89857/g.254542  ORF Transcript_89857/g.254542 Transcript_89857/m.254542 type:complete len:439 (-) Transcript_89857:210-1526(-)
MPTIVEVASASDTLEEHVSGLLVRLGLDVARRAGDEHGEGDGHEGTQEQEHRLDEALGAGGAREDGGADVDQAARPAPPVPPRREAEHYLHDAGEREEGDGADPRREALQAQTQGAGQAPGGARLLRGRRLHADEPLRREARQQHQRQPGGQHRPKHCGLTRARGPHGPGPHARQRKTGLPLPRRPRGCSCCEKASLQDRQPACRPAQPAARQSQGQRNSPGRCPGGPRVRLGPKASARRQEDGTQRASYCTAGCQGDRRAQRGADGNEHDAGCQQGSHDAWPSERVAHCTQTHNRARDTTSQRREECWQGGQKSEEWRGILASPEQGHSHGNSSSSPHNKMQHIEGQQRHVHAGDQYHPSAEFHHEDRYHHGPGARSSAPGQQICHGAEDQEPQRCHAIQAQQGQQRCHQLPGCLWHGAQWLPQLAQKTECTGESQQ